MWGGRGGGGREINTYRWRFIQATLTKPNEISLTLVVTIMHVFDDTHKCINARLIYVTHFLVIRDGRK